MLLLETAVADFAKVVEAQGTGQHVASLPRRTRGVEFDALQPVQDEQRALDVAQLAQGDGQTALARRVAELAEHQ